MEVRIVKLFSNGSNFISIWTSFIIFAHHNDLPTAKTVTIIGWNTRKHIYAVYVPTDTTYNITLLSF